MLINTPDMQNISRAQHAVESRVERTEPQPNSLVHLVLRVGDHQCAYGLQNNAEAFHSHPRYCPAHTRSTKLSTTRFSPALSNRMVSLLPSTSVTLPLPNFW